MRLFRHILLLMQTDVDVKQTYSRFYRNFGIAIGIIAADHTALEAV